VKNRRIITLALGLVFVLAGVYRVLFPQNAVQEMLDLKLPAALSYVLVPFELLLGVLFLSNRHVREAAAATMAFLILAILWGLVLNPGVLLDTHELYVFNATPTDILLHAVYVGLAFLVINDREGSK
jgi:uncharacterized membrane protein YphA (DoxX/SURF4 family)